MSTIIKQYEKNHLHWCNTVSGRRTNSTHLLLKAHSGLSQCSFVALAIISVTYSSQLSNCWNLTHNNIATLKSRCSCFIFLSDISHCGQLGLYSVSVSLRNNGENHAIKTYAVWKLNVSLSQWTLLSLAGKEQAVKLSLPRASSLNENVDHSALLKLGGTVSERVNRFDSKASGEGVCSSMGLSKLQETRRIFEQRTLQVRKLFVLLACVSY